jgi:hypothetical protein
VVRTGPELKSQYHQKKKKKKRKCLNGIVKFNQPQLHIQYFPSDYLRLPKQEMTRKCLQCENTSGSN